MNVEILDFYPIEKNETKGTLTGTLRVKLLDLGVHILGVFVFRKNDFWQFRLPGRSGTHHETGEAVCYPFIVFEERAKQKELVEAIREKGKGFILKRLADVENPLIFPERQKSPSEVSSYGKGGDRAAEAKEKGRGLHQVPDSIKATVPSPVSSFPTKVWVDPPKRNQFKRT